MFEQPYETELNFVLEISFFIKYHFSFFLLQSVLHERTPSDPSLSPLFDVHFAYGLQISDPFQDSDRRLSPSTSKIDLHSVLFNLDLCPL